MGKALAAVTDDRNLLAPDPLGLDVLFIENIHSTPPCQGMVYRHRKKSTIRSEGAAAASILQKCYLDASILHPPRLRGVVTDGRARAHAAHDHLVRRPRVQRKQESGGGGRALVGQGLVVLLRIPGRPRGEPLHGDVRSGYFLRISAMRRSLFCSAGKEGVRVRWKVHVFQCDLHALVRRVTVTPGISWSLSCCWMSWATFARSSGAASSACPEKCLCTRLHLPC